MAWKYNVPSARPERIRGDAKWWRPRHAVAPVNLCKNSECISVHQTTNVDGDVDWGFGYVNCTLEMDVSFSPSAKP